MADVDIPLQVRKQHEAAEQLRKQAYSDTPQEPEEDPQEPEEEQQQVQDTDESQQAQEPETGDSEDDLAERYRKLESAHRTLQGKYQAEVPRLNQQIRELKEQLQNAQSQAAEKAKEADKANAKLDEHLNRLKDEFGDEFAESLTAVAREVAAEQMGNRNQQQGSEVDDQQVFMQRLVKQVPDFQAINRSPEFVQWLNDTQDPVTGLPLHQTLNEAGQRLDLNAVVDVFDEFKRQQKPKPKSQSTAPENQVAPKRGQRQREPARKPSYTPQDLTTLAMQIQRGEWKGREAEAEQLRREIHAAIVG